MAGQIQRRASHAGSWYAASKRELNNQLENWLQAAGPNTNGPARAIISPHAGYQYCGACAAHAYKEICPTTTKRIFILGPSHHIHLSGCALSPASVYKTPFYDLVIDRDIYDDLYASSAFEEMTLYADEDEHSIEMQLSFIAKVMEPVGSQGFKIVPILVGSLSADKEEMYGRLLSKYLADPANVFVISSDFCHWGARFSYQYYDKAWGEIYESIQKLDEMGMNLIESLDPSAFSSYLKKYRNTICGRHPIAVLLNAIAHLRNTSPPSSSNHVVMNGHHSSNHVNNNNHHVVNGIGGSTRSSSNSNKNNNANIKFDATLRFLNYAQSSQCLRMRDSSVSYASATLKINNN